jgi:hypothetical protein
MNPLAEYQDTADQIATLRTEMLAAEDARSIKRNHNRILVLLCGITGSAVWPALMMCTTHSAMLATFGAPIGFVFALGVTVYAMIRRY